MKEKKEHNPYDKIVKENFRKLMGTFLSKIVQISISNSELTEVKDKIPRTLEREPDFVYIVVPEKGEKYCLHIEFQSTDESDMHYRMLEYFALLYRKHKLDVKQYVIYMGEEPPTKMKKNVISQNIIYKYNLISLHNVSYTELIDREEEIKMIDTIPIDVRKDPVFKEGHQIGHQMGHQIGHQIGHKEGEEIGLSKGIELGVFKTVLNCIIKGYTDDLITDITGLSRKRISFLRKKHKEFGKDVFKWLKGYFEKQKK